MKFIALLLSIYIFGLNLVPCEDNGKFTDEVKTEISQVQCNDHQHQDRDLCSPFCSCECCHICILSFNAVDYIIQNPFVSTEVFYYKGGLEKNFNFYILQPPQF
ncbi:DUF6660 family protein [Aestuariivivens sp. NBU2969]|uniref:DUF6660 family protein n=1 Tax=Aestuariivivens sp. NBU2969 TaxID=2873267 RepID=UPI001CBE5083|nr:DUF6660 family protein [Aestuariivivens sp. NBU2969]